MTRESVESAVERKVEEVLPILKETLSDDDAPSEDDLFRASLEASHRIIEASIRHLRASEPLDPRRRSIRRALADDAEANLAAMRAFGLDASEAQRALVVQGILDRMRALKGRITEDAAEPPTPQ